MIQRYQLSEPSITSKYEDGKYHKGYFCGGINSDLKLITCKDKIVIPSILQSCVLYWYHMYLFHPGTDRTEAIIHQQLYWIGIRDAVRKEVNNCDTCQRTKGSNKKHVRLLAKLSEEIPWNKLCVDLI